MFFSFDWWHFSTKNSSGWFHAACTCAKIKKFFLFSSTGVNDGEFFLVVGVLIWTIHSGPSCAWLHVKVVDYGWKTKYDFFNFWLFSSWYYDKFLLWFNFRAGRCFSLVVGWVWLPIVCVSDRTASLAASSDFGMCAPILWLPQGFFWMAFFARLFCVCTLEVLFSSLLPPGMLMVPGLWPSLLCCGTCSPLGLQAFFAQYRDSCLCLGGYCCHVRVFVLWSRDLSPWSQVEQYVNCLVLCLHFLEDIEILLRMCVGVVVCVVFCVWCLVVCVRRGAEFCSQIALLGGMFSPPMTFSSLLLQLGGYAWRLF